MPHNKKHHYVPQFYLRNFSCDTKAVSLFNFKNERVVPSAPIKGQCYKDYLYGETGAAEDALSKVEGATSNILKKVISDNSLPAYLSQDYVMIVFYVVIQNGRTLSAGEDLNEMTDRFAKHLVGRQLPEGITKEDLEKVKVTLTNPVGEALRSAATAYALALDLQPVLIVNETSTEFITSDCPVIMYNQYLEERDFAGNTGLQSVGLQIILPISPKHTVMFFDNGVYGLGRLNPSTINVNALSDVIDLNALQCLAAQENIYFSQSTDVDAVIRQATKLKPKRRKYRTSLHSQVEPLPDGKERELLAIRKIEIKNDLSLSFLKIKKTAKRGKDDAMYRIAVRNEAVVENFQRFREAVKRGRYGHADFLRFMHDRG